MDVTQGRISTAAKRLELARATFDYTEANYFDGCASEAALRRADNERRAAEQELERVHLAAGAVLEVAR